MNTLNYNNKRVTPSKVICIGRNYVEHIKELNNEVPDAMVIFNKPNSAITDTLYYISEDTRFEGEICFLVESAKIIAVGFGLDLTKADLQNKMKSKGLPWERAKAFDRSAVLSQFIPFNDDLASLRFELYINAKLIQFANYELMIYKPKEILQEIESFMRVEDGDIIMSGTPKGVGNYKKGDLFLAKIYSKSELLLQKSGSFKSKREIPLHQIKNYIAINSKLSSAGQPSEIQLQELAAEGVEVIINLGLLDPNYCLESEAELVDALGLEYYHIPVDFQDPKREDLQHFFFLMDTIYEKKICVHCAANKRVSVFIALYAEHKFGLTSQRADAFIQQVWHPNEIWNSFIRQARQELESLYS